MGFAGIGFFGFGVEVRVKVVWYIGESEGRHFYRKK